MVDARCGQRRLIVVAHVDTGDETSLCALYDDGDVVRIAVSDRYVDRGISHAEGHVARGFGLVQLCSVDCSG
jgi:hypothetical protein